MQETDRIMLKKKLLSVFCLWSEEQSWMMLVCPVTTSSNLPDVALFM